MLEHVHTYIPEDQAAKLRAAAHQNDRTIAAELRRAIRLYVQVLDKRAGEPAPEPIQLPTQ